MFCKSLIDSPPVLGTPFELFLGYFECLLFLGMELQQFLQQTDVSQIDRRPFTFILWVGLGSSALIV